MTPRSRLKILFDHNTPSPLRRYLHEHDVDTAAVLIDSTSPANSAGASANNSTRTKRYAGPRIMSGVGIYPTLLVTTITIAASSAWTLRTNGT